MTMRMSPQGREMLIAHEGLVLRAYKDIAGIWTIAVGHSAMAGPPAPFPGMTITRAEAEEILSRDLVKFEKRVLKAVKVPLRQAEFDALVSFDFNTGRIHSASFVQRLNASTTPVQRIEAYRGLMEWNKAQVGGKLRPVRGLTIRRQDEFDLAVHGDYAVHNGAYRGKPIEVSVTAVSRNTAEVEDDELRSLYTDLRDVLKELLKQPQSGEFRAAAVAGVGYLAGYVDTTNKITRITPTASRIIRLVQRALNLKADGIVGPATRAAIHSTLRGRTASVHATRPAAPSVFNERPQGNN